jgi:hypothetical protein
VWRAGLKEAGAWQRIGENKLGVRRVSDGNRRAPGLRSHRDCDAAKGAPRPAVAASASGASAISSLARAWPVAAYDGEAAVWGVLQGLVQLCCNLNG